MILSQTTQEARYIRLTWLVLGLGLIVRLFMSGQFLLVPDEAYYWQWSRYPALGYYDHPPMIAWGIWLATQLFGHTEFAVRLPTVLALALASVYLCLLAIYWFSWRIAFHVALLTQGVLLMAGAALIATPDGMLLLCWAAACYHAARAVERDTLLQWLLTGTWFGLGMLSKYTMVLFLPSLFFAMVFTTAYRQRLLSTRPWLGLVVGCMLFTPVILWNMENNWVTFRHVLFQGGGQGGGDQGPFFTLSFLPDFFGAQAALVSPVIFLCILAGWVQGWAGNQLPRAQASFLIWMSLTTFLVFTLLALHVRIYGNWPAPAYLTAFVLIAALYSPGQVRETRKSRQKASRYYVWWVGLGLSFVTSMLIMAQLLYPVLPIKAAFDRTAQETRGWDTLGEFVDRELQGMPRPDETFIFGLRYQFASELAFYMKGQPRTVSLNRWSRPNVYDFWFQDEMLLGQDAVGIFEHEPVITVLPEVFERVDPVETVTIKRTGPWFGEEKLHTLYLARCYGFKGGLAWVPKDPADVRAVQ